LRPVATEFQRRGGGRGPDVLLLRSYLLLWDGARAGDGWERD
jgi:hypothetical protein